MTNLSHYVVSVFIVLLTIAGPVAAHDDGISSQVSIPNSCPEPLKPIISSYVARVAEDDLRRDFELYFREVEDYLNCLSAETHRVTVEAQQAAYELDQVFSRFPDSPGLTPRIVDRPPMVSSGHLNLDYRGAGG